jgi:arginase family enzyme
VSLLRARCPACRTLTAVAVDSGYECHSCGATFRAGLVRVPRAWGEGGGPIADAAFIELPYPEAVIVAADTLEEQTAALAASLPAIPLVLGGCCCTHTGAIRGLAGRAGRLAVVWLDAHGDLNTPETSVTGNAWGMPLRAAIDEGSVRTEDVALVGARNLDPPEAEYVLATGIDDDVDRALAGADAVYVALDLDVLDPSEVACFMPEPDGLTVGQVELVLRRVAAGPLPIVGMGLTAHVPSTDAALLTGFAAAAGL